MMSNLPAHIGNDLSTLRRLTLQEIYDAFFGQIPICGFYIESIGIGVIPIEDMDVGIRSGLKDITLVHLKTGIKIYLDRDGSATIRIT